MQVYDLIYGHLKSLTLQTEMLEACDWDENILKENINKFSEYISGVFFPSNFTWEMIIESIRASLQNRIEINLIEIFIKVLESEKEAVIKHMTLEEN